jgi:ribonuclease HII
MLPLFKNEHPMVAGCDEAGRGCLAGPVVAGAAILPDDFEHPLLNDSKQIKESQRMQLREFILQHALYAATAMVTHEEIDQINILKASFLAMHRAVDHLGIRPGHLVIDGNRFSPYAGISHTCVIKGDGKYAQIAAASILAKTERDLYMEQLHREFPHYHWLENKGYPTISHRAAIAEFGACTYHRKTFRLLKDGTQGLLF